MTKDGKLLQQQMFEAWRAVPESARTPDFSFLRPLQPTIVFQTYWRFAAERQAIFFRRLKGNPWPWTDDPILSQNKFTNAYRASDRVSQYLIRRVIYEGGQEPEEIFFRILLFKLFNRIETWELLRREFGEVTWGKYTFSTYDAVLSRAIDQGDRIYSGAYIMPSGGRAWEHRRKHQMHLKLLERMLADGLPRKIQGTAFMSEVFALLRAYPTIGDFLAYQYSIDLNYSSLLDFSEMDFVVPGPGAKSGLKKCFSSLGGKSESEAIRLVAAHQQDCIEALGLSFCSLWGRPLQLVDCQNLFCEVDKYARVKHPEFATDSKRTRIKQKFRPTVGQQLSFWFPPKWGLNARIEKGGSGVPNF